MAGICVEGTAGSRKYHGTAVSEADFCRLSHGYWSLSTFCQLEDDCICPSLPMRSYDGWRDSRWGFGIDDLVPVL